MNRPIAPDLDDNPRIPAEWGRTEVVKELQKERRRCAEEITENRRLRQSFDTATRLAARETIRAHDAEEALRELVELKDLRTKIEGPQEAWPDHDSFEAAAADYYKRKAVAWDAARAALSSVNASRDATPPEGTES